MQNINFKMCTSKLVSQISPGINLFVCIDAICGWYPMFVLTRNIDCMIFVLECNSGIYLELDENMRESNTNIELVKKAIGRTRGSFSLFLPKDGNDGMSTLFPLAATESEALELEIVVVTDLDSFFENQNLNLGKALLLLDIEGSQMNVLKGTSRFLLRYQPSLILEINEQMPDAVGRLVFELFTFLDELGYFVYWTDERIRVQLVNQKNPLPHFEILP